MQIPDNRPPIRRVDSVPVDPEPPPSLSPKVLRSAAPGYLLAACAVLALGGFVAWRVVRQTNAIHHAETAPTPAVEAPHAPPESVLVVLPGETAGEEVSRITTTAGLVPAPTTAIPPVPPPAAPAPNVAPPTSGAVHAPKSPHRAHLHRSRPAAPVDHDNPYEAPVFPPRE
jgi:hypothetical protein